MYTIEIIISVIILILIALAVGYIYRKKLYKEVERLETKKLEIMHRPVVTELSKVKRLNMTGETEVLFEKWKSSWDEIIAVKIPGVDELLFDAEEFADKFRFNQAKSVHIKIEMLMDEIDEQISVILAELNELIGSDEHNREEMKEILEKHHLAKKQLIAHRHTFGKSVGALDRQLDLITQEIKDYESLTDQGDYLIARQKVLTLAEEMNVLNEKFDKIPHLIVQCQNNVPNQLSDLHNGYKEMVGQGFELSHLQIEEFYQEATEQLEQLKIELENAEVSLVESDITELLERVDKAFDDLENEAYERRYVLTELEKIDQSLTELIEENEQVIEETEIVKSSYQLKDEDVYLTKDLEKTLNELRTKFDLLNITMEERKTAFSTLSIDLKKIEGQLPIIAEQQIEYKQRLQNLRKDELEARDQLEQFRKTINEALRSVRMSQIPGVPEEFDEYLEQAKDQVAFAENRLEEKPLEMETVKKDVEEAKDRVDYLLEKTTEYIEDAQLAESVIQYGNRYRRRNPELRQSLDEAERLFRNYRFKDALEEAAVAVERVEPGALKRIEQLIQPINN